MPQEPFLPAGLLPEPEDSDETTMLETPVARPGRMRRGVADIPDRWYRATPVVTQEDTTPHLIRALEALTESTRQTRRRNLPTTSFDGSGEINQFFVDFA